MKKIFTCCALILFCLLGNYTNAQTAQGCDGVRYYYDIFDDVSQTTVVYGSNMDAAGQSFELEMDIYQPVGDVQEKRPLMVWAHGGAFVAGNRANMDTTCVGFAKKGFVTATVSYRLYPIAVLGIPDSLEMLDAAMKALGDLKAAIRYFREDANTDNLYQIDTNYIFAAGLSAGAIMAVHAGYLDSQDDIPDYISDILMDNGGLEGSTGSSSNLSYSSEVHGVINLSGGLHKLDWMDSDEPPIASYHGTADDVVPYYHGITNVLGFNFMSINGSGSIHATANNLGINNLLVSAPGGGHESSYNDPAFDQYQQEFIEEGLYFIHDILCQGINVNSEEAIVNPDVFVFPNPSNNEIEINIADAIGGYDLAVYDQSGKLIKLIVDQNNPKFTLRQKDYGVGIFFIQIRMKDNTYAPIVRKVIFIND